MVQAAEQKIRWYDFRRGQAVKITYLDPDGHKIRSEVGTIGYIGSAEPVQGEAFQVRVHHGTETRTVYPVHGECRTSRKGGIPQLFMHGSSRGSVSPGPSNELFVPVNVRPVRG